MKRYRAMHFDGFKKYFFIIETDLISFSISEDQETKIDLTYSDIPIEVRQRKEFINFLNDNENEIKNLR